jgi:UDP-2,3-diacylglucosamine pyrophosphatase LpxH
VKRFKLVVSDFHLGAGHRKRDGSINLLEDFFHDREFIEFLQYFGSGVYENAEVELILNGDFFNLLQVDYDEVDPEVITELVALRRMKVIMEGHRATMNALKHFQSLEGKSLTLVMGNHDPGILFPSVQDLIVKYTGSRTRFFLEAYEFDGVYVEHGNQYESANQFDRKKYFLTEGLPQPVINQPWGSHFYIQVINKIKRTKPHFDKVLPFWTYLKWTVLYDLRFGLRTIGAMIRFFLETRFSRDPRRSRSLRETFRILFGTSQSTPVSPDLDEAAEKILMTREDIHTVIFGHNHRPVFRQFGEAKEYVNTGTWNQMTHLEIDRLGSQLYCTFAMVEYFDNRPRASLKLWRGRRKSYIETDVA